jgi:hypothetical protein
MCPMRHHLDFSKVVAVVVRGRQQRGVMIAVPSTDIDCIVLGFTFSISDGRRQLVVVNKTVASVTLLADLTIIASAMGDVTFPE